MVTKKPATTESRAAAKSSTRSAPLPVSVPAKTPLVTPPKASAKVPVKARVRSAAQRAPRESTASALRSLKRLLDESQDQLSLVHGVLEELCERQEALAAWQMEFSKRLMMLDEAQWRALEDLAGTHFGHPVERMFGPQHPKDFSANDNLNDASEYFEAMSKDLTRKRRERQQQGERTGRRNLLPRSETDEENAGPDGAPESVLVLPAKPELH